VSWCDGRGLCALLHHYQPALLQLSEVEAYTTLTAQAERAAALDDSLNFSYGQADVNTEQYATALDNEKRNFRLVINAVMLTFLFIRLTILAGSQSLSRSCRLFVGLDGAALNLGLAQLRHSVNILMLKI